MTLTECRIRWGARVLLRRDSRLDRPEIEDPKDQPGWRPVFPQLRHQLSPESYQRQLAAFTEWKNRNLTPAPAFDADASPKDGEQREDRNTPTE